MDFSEKIAILNKLQSHGNMYYTFFNLSNIIFSESIQTAAVYMTDPDDDCITLKINPKFWENLTEKQKIFIIGHECLHVMLSHLNRLFTMSKDKEFDMELLNIAADLCVNELLVQSYSFIRSEIDLGFWWLDVAFPDNDVPYGKTMEYYYDLLKQNPDIHSEHTAVLVDDHGNWGSNISDSIIEKIVDSMSSSELEKLKNNIESPKEKNKHAGSSYAYIIKKMKDDKVVKKKKWEAIIDRWVKSKMKVVEHQDYQWTRRNRRFSTIDSKFFLPTEAEATKKKKELISVALFLDTSPSCDSYSQRFFNAAKSIPIDRFEVRAFCFSTYVTEIDLSKAKLVSGWGTSFSIIEKSISKNYSRYPDAVFVITDGYGDTVNPAIPERWFWLLTENYTRFIPAICKIFNLSKYE